MLASRLRSSFINYKNENLYGIKIYLIMILNLILTINRQARARDEFLNIHNFHRIDLTRVPMKTFSDNTKWATRKIEFFLS